MEEQADAFECKLGSFTIMTLPTSAKRKPGQRTRVFLLARETAREDSFRFRNLAEMKIGGPSEIGCLHGVEVHLFDEGQRSETGLPPAAAPFQLRPQ